MSGDTRVLRLGHFRLAIDKGVEVFQPILEYLDEYFHLRQKLKNLRVDSGPPTTMRERVQTNKDQTIV